MHGTRRTARKSCVTSSDGYHRRTERARRPSTGIQSKHCVSSSPPNNILSSLCKKAPPWSANLCFLCPTFGGQSVSLSTIAHQRLGTVQAATDKPSRARTENEGPISTIFTYSTLDRSSHQNSKQSPNLHLVPKRVVGTAEKVCDQVEQW
jgi:hypothetical protein